ncbi:MAG: alpha/beta hydrolase [Actinomycetota bacterium]
MRVIRRIFGLLGLTWLAWRLFGPELEPGYRGDQRRPVHIPGRTVFVGEREFFVRETGPEDGPPLVLAHGWGFDGEMNFHTIVPALAERFRVIVPDHRNHGKSERIRGSFDIEDLADELVGVLDTLGCGRVDLLGYSLGGLAAQVVAHRHPERVRRLILAGTAAYPVARLRSGAAIGIWLVRAFARLSKKETSMFTFSYLRRNRLLDPSHERWMWTAHLNRDPTLSYESAFAAWRFDSRHWVGEIAAPTMVIIPTEDQVVPPATQRDLAERIHAQRVVELDGVGHESVLARPDEYVEAITEFLLESGVDTGEISSVSTPDV